MYSMANKEEAARAVVVAKYSNDSPQIQQDVCLFFLLLFLFFAFLVVWLSFLVVCLFSFFILYISYFCIFANFFLFFYC